MGSKVNNLVLFVNNASGFLQYEYISSFWKKLRIKICFVMTKFLKALDGGGDELENSTKILQWYYCKLFYFPPTIYELCGMDAD